jgi:hypothetical protein
MPGGFVRRGQRSRFYARGQCHDDAWGRVEHTTTARPHSTHTAWNLSPGSRRRLTVER